MRVLVTGSRNWIDDRLIQGAMADIMSEHRGLDSAASITLVSGACPTGADRMAEQIADDLGWTIETHPADWHKFGKRAGFLRNSHMVDLGADICIAFIRNDSKGASMTARLAEKAGIPTRRFTDD